MLELDFLLVNYQLSHLMAICITQLDGKQTMGYSEYFKISKLASYFH